MELTLQQIVDGLAQRVDRPAVLEDRFLRLVAYSAHDQALDHVREDSILRRHASREVRSWLNRFGVATARQPFRVPSNPELNMLSRVCVPIAHHDKVLGYLWFVDPDASMTPAEIECCVREAADLGEQLYRENMVSLFTTKRLADTLHMLLNDSPMAVEAAASLTEAGYMSAESGVTVVVLQGAGADRVGTADVEEPLAQAMSEFRRVERRAQALYLTRKDHGVLLLSSNSDDRRLRERIDLAIQLATHALAASDSSASLLVGVGGHQGDLTDARESFLEARMSVDAARQLPGLGDVVHWSRLGVHQIVVKLASLGEQIPVLHPGLGHLLTDPDALPLLETLETYLDVAGNAQVTAERLNLHRTSLYYRLQRLEQLAHTDLKNGVERLSLHLALKVARMTGQYLPRNTGEPRSSRPVPGQRRSHGDPASAAAG